MFALIPRSRPRRPPALVGEKLSLGLMGLGLGLGLGLAGTEAAWGQAIVPAADGVQTQVLQQDQRYEITGGSRSGDGANLFHSFERFGLGATDAATFLIDPTVRNVLGRIVGGDASYLDGLIQVLGGQADLYLMNPAGIVFGPQVRLDVPGSFMGTTATGLGFGAAESEAWFGTVGLPSWTALNGAPTAARFEGAIAGSIVNFGTLGVGAGHQLTLLGGNVLLPEGSVLRAPGGRITLAAVPGTSRVRWGEVGSLLTLEIDLMAPEGLGTGAAAMTPLSLPALLTGAGRGTSAAAIATTTNDGRVILRGDSAIAGTVLTDGTVTSAATGAARGQINLLGDRVLVRSGEVSAPGGGQIRLGGGVWGVTTFPRPPPRSSAPRPRCARTGAIAATAAP